MGGCTHSYHIMPLTEGKKKFFSQMLQTLQTLMEGVIIMGGDSNLAFYTGMDKSKPLRAQVI